MSCDITDVNYYWSVNYGRQHCGAVGWEVEFNQSINLLCNKGPKATYKSQNTIYNNYSPRQCIQYIKNHASEKAVYKLYKIQFTEQ